MCDYWSAGIFLYELMVGKTPFMGPNNDKSSRPATVSNLILRAEPQYPDTLSRTTIDFLKALLMKIPHERLGANGGFEEIKNHDYFKSINFDLVEQKKYTPPIKINLRGDGDTKYISNEFLKMEVNEEEIDFEARRKYFKVSSVFNVSLSVVTVKYVYASNSVLIKSTIKSAYLYQVIFLNCFYFIDKLFRL